MHVAMHETSGGIEWDCSSVAGARDLLERLERQVALRDGFAKPLATVAGLAVTFEAGNLRATALLMDVRDPSKLERRTIEPSASATGTPELLFCQALQALLEVVRGLSTVPDLALVASRGIAQRHRPQRQRFGIASHFGVAAGIPAIGVTLEEVIGSAAPLHRIRGAYTPLRDGGTQVGWLLRSEVDSDPLAVSPGHRVAMASAADLVMRFVERDRLPEPLRLAFGFASSGVTPTAGERG